MNHLTTELQTACLSGNVATAAEFLVGWSNHVFISWGDDDFSGSINIGRLPLVVIREVSTDYLNEAENGGTRDADFIIRIYVSAIKPRLNSNIVILHNIKRAILSNLKNTSLEARDIVTTTPQILPFAAYIDITITSETSYDLDYEEN